MHGSAREFDGFITGLDHPMFLVTAADPLSGARAGCLVGFATQCSIAPRRFLVCISQHNATHAVALGAQVLAVHAPARDQHHLAALFGGETGDEIDKFADIEWQPGPFNVPLLVACPRRLVGRVLEASVLGDHTGFLLGPLEGTAPSHVRVDPLMFSDVQDIAAGHDAG
jgi:flavin reductase (DIM6/NTAB) family NADH-FMN oxidoreductase RutF